MPGAKQSEGRSSVLHCILQVPEFGGNIVKNGHGLSHTSWASHLTIYFGKQISCLLYRISYMLNISYHTLVISPLLV